MNREIVFRGLKADGSNEWVYGNLINVYDPTQENDIVIEQYIHPCTRISNFIQVIPSTVGQFTGLTDKNGTRIFEYDKVKGRYFIQRSVDPNSEQQIIHFEGVINYSEGCFYVSSNDGGNVFSFNYPDFEIEVIGNIHQK